MAGKGGEPACCSEDFPSPRETSPSDLSQGPSRQRLLSQTGPLHPGGTVSGQGQRRPCLSLGNAVTVLSLALPLP